jgi:hypothetical protein
LFVGKGWYKYEKPGGKIATYDEEVTMTTISKDEIMLFTSCATKYVSVLMKVKFIQL